MARQPSKQPNWRVEHDFLGERQIPSDALYGIHTVRATENFNLGGEKLSDRPELIVALAQVKAATAKANSDLGVLDPTIAEAILAGARDLSNGLLHDQFPLDLVQGGGGTSTHMNVNEVIANRANAYLGKAFGDYSSVHPYDHVNRSQSTNDVLPTAMGIAVYRSSRQAQAGLSHLRDELLRQGDLHEGLEHLGRTCLQDAVPVPISALHKAQGYAVNRSADDLRTAADRVLAVPLGATAVGTGLGAPDGFRELAIEYLRDETGLDVRPAEDLFASLASLEEFASVADAMARSGRVLSRVAADLRLLASGPIGGLGEVELPALQAGSSIMPGKVNPVLPELVMQVSYQLAGAAHAVQLATGAGELEVTTMGPVVASELLRGLARLERVAFLFADLCIAGLTWKLDRVEANLRGSLRDAVESAERNGYEEAVLARWEADQVE